MRPKVLIVVSGGCVEDVQANLPGIDVEINDVDQQEAGEPYTTCFEASSVTPDGGQPGTPLTENELERFYKEMEGNHDGNITTVALLLHLIGRVPAAAATLRAWLADAEAETRVQEPGDAYWEDEHQGDVATVETDLS